MTAPSWGELNNTVPQLFWPYGSALAALSLCAIAHIGNAQVTVPFDWVFNTDAAFARCLPDVYCFHYLGKYLAIYFRYSSTLGMPRRQSTLCACCQGK
ncbi:hypothetical protein HD806DRAFT_165572 [Xylariaceae sp. AK1471]|nr:hypothetical protein HD806DRAFT_165572 [Xylariaceae sp. AK1471]